GAAARNLMATSSAAMLVSFHAPSPMLKARRWIGSWPSNTCWAPCALTLRGKLTSWVLPLMVSLPLTVSLPAPAGLIEDDTKLAFGNCAELNHSFLAISLL